MALHIADDFAAINAAGKKLRGETGEPEWCWQRPARIQAVEVGADTASVFLDGSLTEGWIAADAEHGWIEIPATDGKGRPIAGATERKAGKVEIYR